MDIAAVEDLLALLFGQEALARRLAAALQPQLAVALEAAVSPAAQPAAGPAASAAARAFGGSNHLVACSSYFAPPADGCMRGAAAAAAAKAAAAAMRQADAQAGATPAAAVQLSVQGALEGLAALPPVRLGEIAAPAGLSYSLRAAQALRALVAAPPAAAAAGAARGTSCAPSGSHAALCSSIFAGAPLLLSLAVDPCLDPIPCPPAAAAQCGELRRLLEVLQEEEDAAGADVVAESSSDTASGASAAASPLPQQPQQQRRRELALHGVAPEEHSALHQLVRCLAGQTHAGLLEATQLLDVARLADLLDAPALLSEALSVLACMAPGPEMFAPLLALAEARQFSLPLQRLKLFYGHALALHLLEGRQPLLAWALHGLQAGVDSVLQVCIEVAARWLPLQPGLYLGTPSGDLAALTSAGWQAAVASASAQCGRHGQHKLVRSLLEALLPLLRQRLARAQEQPAAKRARLGPFQQAAAQPKARPVPPSALSSQQLQERVQQALQQLQTALPQQAAQERQQRTAALFAEAEARARRQRRLAERAGRV